jgi:hypothetical protein
LIKGKEPNPKFMTTKRWEYWESIKKDGIVAKVKIPAPGKGAAVGEVIPLKPSGKATWQMTGKELRKELEDWKASTIKPELDKINADMLSIKSRKKIIEDKWKEGHAAAGRAYGKKIDLEKVTDKRITQWYDSSGDHNSWSGNWKSQMYKETRELEEAIWPLTDAKSKLTKATKKKLTDLLTLPKDQQTNMKAYTYSTNRTFNNKLKQANKKVNEIVSKDFSNYSQPSASQLRAKERAYASAGDIYVAPDARPATFAHELGHTFEHNSYETKNKVRAFRKRRVGDERLQSLKKVTGINYDADEMCRPDQFIDAYMGKYYQGGSTEILSMGLEYLTYSPTKLLAKDTDYFDFMVDLLRGLAK